MRRKNRGAVVISKGYDARPTHVACSSCSASWPKSDPQATQKRDQHAKACFRVQAALQRQAQLKRLIQEQRQDAAS